MSAGITRRGLAALSAGALALRALPARAVGDTFVSGWGLPANLDPHQVFDVPMQTVMFNVYDNLYRYENDPPQIVPWLAKSHTVSADGLTWDFELRPGIKFHDGSALTADDVVYSFHRVLGLKLAPAGAFLPILKPENVTATGPLTVRFVLSKPYAPFFAAIPIISIVNQRAIKPHEKDGDWGKSWLASNGAGSGAYKVVPATYRPLESLDLDIHDAHFMGWDDNKNPVRKVAVRPTAETSTRILALLNGSLDWTDTNLPADQVDKINASKVAHVEKNTVMRTFIVRMHNQRAPFDNINVRKAFACAFNYMGFINDILGGYATRDPLPMPDNLWGAPKDVKGYSYDLAKAKEYLAKAQAEGAQQLKRPIELHVQSENDQSVQAAQMFQSDLAEIGINLKVVPDTWANMTANMSTPQNTPDMWVHWVSTYFVDPENWVGQMYDSQFHGTWKASSWYENPKVDALLRKARATLAQEERAPLYEEAIRLIVADCPDIFVYNSMQLQGINNRVKGRRFCTVGQGCEMRWISI
ncbi:MAG TPA: ABC transporter substrate-binding protein [Rhodopila sp.]|uniref:ABC transporter substrate-binding protein n=1 Tax=Rhodopila sp. TaxID=2480087 RepID=UPI002CFA2877|nr:ABC transporter substrate-binding protein [Rhodopila sp.]HVY16423.1 ABC transporter substrate-binding protein [Rhodopila sp.]